MNRAIKVIWIDDEWDKMIPFKDECRIIHNIELIPFKTQREGMKELELHLDQYDAVLLDAKMFDQTENEVAKITGLHKAIETINRLSSKKYVPYFISTGQPDLMTSEQFQETYEHFYIKERDDSCLIEDLKRTVLSLPIKQIELTYHDVFDAILELGLNSHAENIIKDILLALHYSGYYPDFKPLLYYNQLRQLLEYIFRACNNVGVIPDDCLPNNIVNLNQCSIFLAGKNADHIGIRYGKEGDRIIPKHIENIIRSVLELGNVHSHTVDLDEEDINKLEEFFLSTHSRYVICGLCLQLCDLILWFRNYLESHSDKEENLSKVRRIEETKEEDLPSDMIGKEYIPEQDESGNWHCEDCLVKLSYWTSGKMRIKEIYKNTDSRTSALYPFFAKYEKIE